MKPNEVNPSGKRSLVAPSRERGLKLHDNVEITFSERSRSFTGAWIETLKKRFQQLLFNSRSFTGAWIETVSKVKEHSRAFRRSFTGAWIETVSL